MNEADDDPGSPEGGPGHDVGGPGHDIGGPLLAVRVIISWMTILPTGRIPIPGGSLAGRAITALPVVGLICGAATAAVASGAFAIGASPLLAAVSGLAASVLLTRGMHVDAVSDTADALGSYAGPRRALEIMHSGTSGPMGVTALLFVFLVQAAAMAQLVAAGAAVAVIAAFVIGRCLPIVLCRRGVPAASEFGFGALVAESQGRAATAFAVTIALLAGALLAVGAPWSDASVVQPIWTLVVGALVGAALCLAAVGAGRHVVRRFGGITGDVLGAAIEFGVTVALVAAALLVAVG